jgi:hypothetical protein
MRFARSIPLAALLLAAAAAPAGAGSAVTCSFSVHLAFDPGISTPRSTGSFATDGPGATACSGMSDTMAVAGEGGLSVTGTHRPGTLAGLTDADCLDGVATMRFATRVRDAIGLATKRWRRVTGAITLTRIGAAWTGGGEMYGGRSSVSLAAVLVPDAGQDCWDTPVTGGTLHGRMIIRR